MILVTGATGLIGSFIVRELTQQGFKVRILKRANSDLTLLKEYLKDIDVVEGDILDVLSLEVALKGVESVIHSAGFISFNPSEKEQLFKINVEGTSNLVNTAINFQIKRFVYISSVAALGKNKKEANKEVDENVKWEENGVGSYARSKYLGELEVWRGASEGLNVGIMNPSVVIGPGNWNSGSTYIFKYIWDKKPFYTEGSINIVDVRDVAFATVEALKRNINSERYILNGGRVESLQLFKEIAHNFGKPTPKIKVSRPIFLLLSYLEKIRSVLANTKPLITRESATGAFSQTIYINKKAKENLNLSFKDINESLSWACRELVKKYNLQIKN